MASRVLHMAPSTADRDPGLALCRNQFHGGPRPSTTRGGGMGGEVRYELLDFDVFHFFLSFLIHAYCNDDCMYMQMWAQSDQPAYPLQRGEVNLQPTLRQGVSWGRS